MGERGWTQNGSEWLEGRVLDAVFAAAEVGWEADFAAVAEDCGVDLSQVDAVVASLRDQGLVSVEGSLGGGLSSQGVLITDAGRVAARRRAQRRGDASLRAVEWSPAEWCTTDLSERVPPTWARPPGGSFE